MSQSWLQTSIVFCGQTFAPPKTGLPVAQFPPRTKKYQMADGGPDDTDAGLCVKEPLGTHVSGGTLKFRLSGVSKAKVDAVGACTFAPRTPVEFRIVEGETTVEGYTCVFADGGFSRGLLAQQAYSDPSGWFMDVSLEILAAIAGGT
jgi:hypothetical protein